MALAQSLGTFENFKKHPVGGFVGAYDTPHITTEDFSQSDALINALSKGADALVDFEHQREDYRKEYGLAKAQELINSTSEKDRLELDTRTLLTNAGMLNLTDNFYAMSLLEKNVGETAAKSFTRDYMHELSIHPDSYKKTRQEQLDDYATKRKEFYNAIKEKRAFSNPLAFDLGFHDHAPLDEGAVFDSHTKWLDEQSHKEALITLSDKFKQYSLDLLHNTEADNGETLGLFKAAINEAKLQGIRPEEIAKAIDAKIHDYLLSGKSDTKALDALKELEIGVWHTGDENYGKPMTYGEFMGTSISPYYKAFKEESNKIVTRHRLELMDTARQKARGDKQGFYDWYESLSQDDKEYLSPHMATLSAQGDSWREAQARTRIKGTQRQSAGIFNASRTQNLFNNIKNDMPVANTLKDMGIDDPNEVTGQILGMIQYQMEPPETMLKILDHPILKSISGNIKDGVLGMLSSITSTSIEGQESKQRAVNQLEYFKQQFVSNPERFLSVYGDAITSRINTYKSLGDVYGVDGAVVQYTKGQDLMADKEAYAGVMESAKDAIKNSSVSFTLTGMKGGSFTVNPLEIGGVAPVILNSVASSIAAGLSPDKVMSDTASFLNNAYIVYNYDNYRAVIPRSFMSGAGTHEDGSPMGISTETYDDVITNELQSFIKWDSTVPFTINWNSVRNQLEIYNAATGQTKYLTPEMLYNAANIREREKEPEDMEQQRVEAEKQREEAARGISDTGEYLDRMGAAAYVM